GAEGAYHVQRLRQCLAALQRPLRGELDGRAVRHRIGEGHADLDEVGAGAGQRLQDRERGFGIRIAGRDEGHERRAALGAAGGKAPVDTAHQNCPPRMSATCGTSLSPRPERLTTMMWSCGFCGASSITLARAWAGSSAGMMPSSLDRSMKASSASLSVAEI